MPHYKIVDYTYPTAGELARLILQYKNIEYEDEKLESPDRIYEAEEGTKNYLLVFYLCIFFFFTFLYISRITQNILECPKSVRIKEKIKHLSWNTFQSQRYHSKNENSKV